MSWEGHLSGFIVGLALALIYKTKHIVKPKYEWEKKDYDSKDDEFMQLFDEDGNFTFVVQQVTLNGQNQVSLATPLARVSRAFNNNNVDLAGDVYVYEDDTTSAGVPDTDSLVHLLIRGSENRNQSFKASTTISNVDFYIVTQFAVSLEAKQASFVDGELEVRLKGGVFRERLNLAASSSGGIAQVDLNPALIIPNNSDVRIRGLADSNGRTVSGYINGYLAINQNVI